MHILLFILSILALLIGFLLMGVARGAIHEIFGGVFFVIAAVLLSGAAVVDAVHRLRRDLTSAVRPAPPASR